MKKISLTFLFAAVAVLLVSVAPAQKTAKFKRVDKGVPNQYIVVLNQSYVDSAVAEPSVRSNSEYLQYVYGGTVKRNFGNAIKGYVSEMTESQAMRLSRDERVAYVEQDSYTTAEGVQNSATATLDRIDQRAFPLDTRYTYATDASNVHAYVIDSGIRTTHTSFGGRASSDFDAINDGNQDCLGHGTHVAGTIGSATWGVAKNLWLHSVRVMGCSTSGTISDLIAGIDWVANNHNSPAVANISITASANSNSLNSAVNALVRSGVTVVTAAGNYGSDACNYSPANVANAITVGAIGFSGTDDLKWAGSNYGSCVDIWAPGIQVASASNGDDTSGRSMSGTSMASPHVAGVAALYLATNPTASPATVAQNVLGSATTGTIANIDAVSPNKVVYSWFNGTPPPPQSATVTIKKKANRRTEATSNTSFSFNAVNLAASNFSLLPDNTFTDSNVNPLNAITVTEAQVFGWQLSSITCNAANSTVDLVNRKVSITPQEGQQVECTFTSDELAPTAAGVTVTGRVVSMDGRGVRGVQITILDATTGTLKSTVTNTFGNYIFSDLPVAHFYVLTAVSTARNPIRNNVQTFTLSDDLKAPSFVSSRY